MLEKIYRKKANIQELRQGALGIYIDGFALCLQELGYSRKQLRFRLIVIRKLSNWLIKSHIDLSDLTEEKLNDFIKTRKKQIKNFSQSGNLKMLMFFIDYLRSKKVIPPSLPLIAKNKPVDKIILAYEKYLDEDKGLCASTIKRNKNIVFDFLCKQFGNNEFKSQKITRNVILNHIGTFKEQHGPKGAGRMVCGLRSFLRYLVMIGELGFQLADCIPAMPSWRAAHLPIFLVKSETKKLLKACDRRTANGRRNYAILLLLLRLGLRASEVLNLTLDNINWDLGELDINGKGRKHRTLPLPSDVGAALAFYLRYVRPKCLDRQVFIRNQPPYKGMSNPSSISSIVRRALIAAGIKSQQMGAHLLRYTAAMETLSSGATLFEIAELLGHCSIDTTAIYTKINVVSLKELAQPWPIQ